MKKRIGFVSNSSSSSFVVASEKGVPLKATIEVDLSELKTGTVKTIEQLDSYMLERNGYRYEDKSIEELFEEEPYLIIDYNNMVKSILDGKVLTMLEASSEDCDSIGQYLYGRTNELMLPDNIKMVVDDE